MTSRQAKAAERKASRARIEAAQAETRAVAYTVVDADCAERFATTDYESRASAERARNQLALEYGKEFCLEVWGIDSRGDLFELTNSNGWSHRG